MKRSGPLQRRTPLARGGRKPLTRAAFKQAWPVRPLRARRQRASAAEKAYMARVAQVGCIVCSRCLGIAGTPAEVHHLKAGGGSKRASHFDTMPLCPEHHRGASGIHLLGQERFRDTYGVTELELLRWFQALMRTDAARAAEGGSDGR
jgi:hypothetical protein